MSYVDNSAAERRAQEANHYHPTPWLRKWALAETGTFIQSPLRGDTVLCLPAERPIAAASCNHVSVTTDNLSGNALHSGIAGGRQDDRRRLILKTYEVHWCHSGILAQQQLITLLTDLQRRYQKTWLLQARARSPESLRRMERPAYTKENVPLIMLKSPRSRSAGPWRHWNSSNMVLSSCLHFKVHSHH